MFACSCTVSALMQPFLYKTPTIPQPLDLQSLQLPAQKQLNLVLMIVGMYYFHL